MGGKIAETDRLISPTALGDLGHLSSLADGQRLIPLWPFGSPHLSSNLVETSIFKCLKYCNFIIVLLIGSQEGGR